MRRIYKYKLKVIGSQLIDIPICFEILKVGIQDGEPVMWILVDPDTDNIQLIFHIIGTGNPVPNNQLQYIDTFQYQEAYWFHVFLEL